MILGSRVLHLTLKKEWFDLMIEFGVGTEASTSFETYKIDEDYFSE